MSGTISVETAADWIDKDAQTVRVMIQNGVSWGEAIKGRGRDYIYLIYAEKFADATGYREYNYNPQEAGASGRFCEESLKYLDALKEVSMDAAVEGNNLLVNMCNHITDEINARIDMLRVE